ncbi:MAG: cobyric acid synthase CobQ, partial [Pseudobutyrivibrio sp.]|nr:cobyric acid synthase CobQ [Pseudobutyrivibrio sp.]
MCDQKYRSQTEDCFDDMTGVYATLSGEEFIGYEIHNGESQIEGDFSGLIERDMEGKIILIQKDNILGTYVHGIFDNGDLAFRLAGALADKKSVTLTESVADYHSIKEAEYDKLADIIRENLDMEFIYRLIK